MGIGKSGDNVLKDDLDDLTSVCVCVCVWVKALRSEGTWSSNFV